MIILAASYGTVSDIEVAWTLLAFTGLIFSLFNLRNSYLDLRETDNLTNGRRIIAVSQMKLESTRIIIQLLFLAIGVGAMFLVDASTAALPLKYQLFGALFRWGLIVSALLITYQSYLSWKIRQVLLAPHVTTTTTTIITEAPLTLEEEHSIIEEEVRRGPDDDSDI